MKTSKKLASRKRSRDRYLELIQQFPLRPIRNDEELDEAIAVLNPLLDVRDWRQWDQDEDDYILVLGDLIEKYEQEHFPVERQPDSAMLRHLIEAKGVNQAQVAKDCRIAESTISEVLAGTRKLNRTHIGKLSAYFHVLAGVFSFEA